MFPFAVFALIVPAITVHGADGDRAKILALARLPEMDVSAQFQYAQTTGYTLSSSGSPEIRTPETLRTQLKAEDSDAPIYHEIGNLEYARGSASAAKEAWLKSLALDRHALTLKPDDPSRLGQIACTLHELGRREERDRALKEAAGKGPASAKLWQVRGQLGLADSLETLSGRMADISDLSNPSAIEAVFHPAPTMAQMETALHQVEEARQCFDRAIETEPGSGTLYSDCAVFRAECQLETDLLNLHLKQMSLSDEQLGKVYGDYARAFVAGPSVADHMKAAQLSHGNPYAIGMAGVSLLFSELQALPPIPPDKPRQEALALVKPETRKTLLDLMANLEEQVKGPDHDLAGRSALALGVMKMLAASLEAADQSLTKAMDLLPNDPRPRELLVSVAMQKKEAARARELAEQAVKVSESRYRRMILGRIALKQDDWGRVEMEERKAVEDDPKSFDANLALTVALLHNAGTDAELKAAGEQLIRTQGLAPASPTLSQYFDFNFTTAIYYGAIGEASEGRKKLEELRGHIDNDQSEAVKKLLALLPLS